MVEHWECYFCKALTPVEKDVCSKCNRTKEQSVVAKREQVAKPPQESVSERHALSHEGSDLRSQMQGADGVSQRKPVRKAALLLITFFLGGMGGHKFYLGKYWQGVPYALFWWSFIPGIVALVEFVIYAFTSADRLKEKYSAEGAGAVIFLGAMAGSLFMAALASFPAYRDFTKRAKVSEGIAIATNLKRAIEQEFYMRGPSDMSCSLETCQVDSVDLHPTPSVKRVASDKSGMITIEYDESVFGAQRKMLMISPIIDRRFENLSDPTTRVKAITWRCGPLDSTTTIPEQYWSQRLCQ